MYKFKFTLDEYESYFKIALGLTKGKNIFSVKLKALAILFFVLLNLLISMLNIKLLLKISIVVSLLLVALLFAISSKKVLQKNSRIVSKLLSRKFSKSIYSEKSTEIIGDEVVQKGKDSSFSTKLCDIKEIIVDKNIIALISSYDEICAFVPLRVFADDTEKEKFLELLNVKDNVSSFDEDMDFAYKLTPNDYANYIDIYNSHIGVNKKRDKIIKILLIVLGSVFGLHYSYKYGLLYGVIFILLIVLIYRIYPNFVNSDKLKKIRDKQSIMYFKKHKEIKNTQQIKVESDNIIHLSNGVRKEFNLKGIKKAYFKNGTIVVLSSNNLPCFIMPDNVFSSERERDDFLDLLNGV
ncbi:hypothetical protein R3379_14795 [Bacillus sp. BAU-SS-2023]|nr:hypothetical protein [Bacillus sp. BAU-SS-2023]